MDQSVPSRSPWLLAGIIALGLMLTFVISSRTLYFDTSILELGDSAVNALQIDNAKHGTEIYGNYSRYHFNHPGPVLFYVDAAGELILRDWLKVVPSPNNAHLLTSLLVQVACLSLALAIMHCWFDSWIFLSAALLAGLWHFAQVPGSFNSIWPPHLLLMPFLCFITAASSFAAGRTRDLAVMTVAGGILFHAHVAQPLFVGGLGVLAAALYRRREKRSATWPGGRAWMKAHSGLLVFCGTWTALMLLPLAIDVCLYGGASNVATIVRRFLVNTEEHKSLLQSLLYFLSFPTYATNQAEVFTQLDASSWRFFLDHLPVLLGWLAVVGGPAWLAWSWRQRLPGPLRDFLGAGYQVWGGTALLCIVWGVLQSGPMHQYNGAFYHGVFYFLGLLGLGVLAHFFGRKCPGSIVAVVCGLALIPAAAKFRLIPGDNEETGQRIRQGVEAALAKTPRHLPVLLVFEHYGWDQAGVPVALELQRRGIPFYASSSWNFMLGRRHDVSLLGPAPEQVATIWWITNPAPDGIQITKELAIFTEPAPLDPRGTGISFAKQAGGFRYLVSGLSTGNVEIAWSEQPRVSLLFKPLRAAADVQLIIEAQNNPRPEAKGPRLGDIFFNDVAIGSVTAAEHRLFTLTVPQALWNSAPRAKLELRFPQATRVRYFSQPANIQWAAWGLWSLAFATPDQTGAPVASGPAKEATPGLIATLPALNGRIDFTELGNLARYRFTGLAKPDIDSTRIEGSHMDLLFHPAHATADVHVQIIAYPFPTEGPPGKQRCELYFTDQFIYNAPFIGPGVIRVAIPPELWNSRPIDSIRLHLPDAVSAGVKGQPAQGLAIRWLSTMPLDHQP